MTSQVLILAGGLGTRLGKLTQEVPKPMLPIGEKPFLDYLLKLLISHGLKRFVFCIGYKAYQIRDYFGNGESLGCEIQYSIEKDLLGTGGAIKLAHALLEDSFLLINGDNYLPMNYGELVKAFESQQDMTGLIACLKNQSPRHRNNLILEESTGQILSYDYQNAEGKTYLDCGAKIFSKKLLNYFADRDKFSLEIDVMGRLAEEKQLAGFKIDVEPLDIGIPENLERAKKVLLKELKS